MGFDFTEIAAISNHFTGEMAGGISFNQDTIQIEGIYVLKNSRTAPDFAQMIYLPWMDKFNQTMAQNLEALTGQKFKGIFYAPKKATLPVARFMASGLICLPF